MEFESASLVIREPRVAAPNASERVRRLWARRLAKVRGEWHIWVYCCYWRVIAEGGEVAWSESLDKRTDAAAKLLDGQMQTAVEADPAKGASAFAFDLGASLQTWPYDDDDSAEQWMFYMKDGNVLTYRADGHCSVVPGQSSAVGVWRPLR